MKRIGIIGLCLMAAFALSAVAVASAAAAPEILFKEPTGKFPVTFTSKTLETSVLESKKAKVECLSATNTGTIETAHLGKTTIRFEKCGTTILGVKLKCYSEGATKTEEEEGIINIVTSVHLGLVPTEKAALLFLLPGGKFTFECTKNAKIEVTGEVIALLTDLENKPAVQGVDYTSLRLHFNQVKGVQEDQTFELMFLKKEGSFLMEKVHLNSKLNAEAAEEAGQQATADLEKFKAANGESPSLELILG